MVFSMTGYGRSQQTFESKEIIVEIKSVNSKQADISTKIPAQYKSKEIAIRQLLTEKLGRGKIELYLRIDNHSEQTNLKINRATAIGFFDQMSQIMLEKGIDPLKEQIFQSILRMPEVVQSVEDTLNEAEWKVVEKTILVAVDELNNFRQQEGESLKTDFLLRIKNIETLLAEVPKFEHERNSALKNRMEINLKDWVKTENFDQNRFEQEIIYYLEKLDITEEKVRLVNHCNYFIYTLLNEKKQGKKLGFIAQEIGREINTLGSKANHSDIQKLVVQMKDDLEKIKEQVLNVL